MLRFQTIGRIIWIIQRNAVSDEQQGAAQQLQVSFMLAGGDLVNHFRGFSNDGGVLKESKFWTI